MGLFSGKRSAGDQSNPIEDYVFSKLSQSELLNEIIRLISNNENQQNNTAWLSNCIGYYDSCSREIRIQPDCFEVLWQKPIFENYELVFREVSCGFRYTDYGYEPLSSYTHRASGTVVPLHVVLNIWSSVIREKMKTVFPDFEFEEIYTGISELNGFRYKVPGRTWKTWF